MEKSRHDDDYTDWLSNQIWEEAFTHYLKQGYSEEAAEEKANESLDYVVANGV